jgi:radical SAM superfamily enzyme YgiQ (UPF0313 family)
LYHCKFCCVKSGRQFQARSENDIRRQIRQLKLFYGRNLENYNALFLGNHDALEAGDELVFIAASEAYKAFQFETRAETTHLFMFGSVDSLLKSKNRVFERIDHLPFYTYVNIGLESFDKSTLDFIGKPLNETKVGEAFKRMLEINDTFKNIEVTANFVIGKGLPVEHYSSLQEVLREAPVKSGGKGIIYLSPLKDSFKKR